MKKEKEKQVAQVSKTSLEDLFAKASGSNKIKEIAILLKADVQGSLEAVAASLMKIANDEIKVKILHKAVGGITESDVALASASNAIILGFNVRANNAAKMLIDKDRVDVRYYSIIYELLDDVKTIMGGMLEPIRRENMIGKAEIRQVFVMSKYGKVGGTFVLEGVIRRGAGARLLRDNVVIHEGKLKTLRRFKDDVKEVASGYECGIAFENYEDIKEKDIIEAFETVEEKRVL